MKNIKLIFNMKKVDRKINKKKENIIFIDIKKTKNLKIREKVRKVIGIFFLIK